MGDVNRQHDMTADGRDRDGIAGVGARPDSYEAEILHRFHRRIEIFGGAGDDWRFAESLKSISEDTAQEYEGRALLELLQNGHDALGEGDPGRVRFVLDMDAGEHGTLYVANEGQPFRGSNFRAITEVGLSDKPAGEGIGNKGLGFRSVLQLTDWPEIYSKSDPGDSVFGGYCFRFAAADDVRALLTDPALADEVIDKVSPLALPVPAAVTDQRVVDLGSQGFATVIRLPLRNERAAKVTLDQLQSLSDFDAPLLLFLERITAVEIECGSTQPSPKVLERAEPPSSVLPQVPWVTDVDLGEQGRFLRATRAVPMEGMRQAIAASIEAREIDEKWLKWDSEAVVSIALGLDAPAEPGQLYTFLPMAESAPAPFAGHAHAPFFTKLARLDISETVSLNQFLLDEVAALARDLLTELTALSPEALPPGLTIDLAGWSPPDRLRQAFGAVKRDLLDEPFVPVIGESRWGSLNESYLWPHQSTTVVTSEALDHVGVRVLDDRVGQAHRARVERLHQAVVGRSMKPELSEASEWAEKIAERLNDEDVDADRWAEFYDDLATIFAESPAALAGREIILDQDRRLTRALGSSSSKRTVFFAPDDTSDETAARLPSDLRALHRRIAFTHPGIPWTLSGTPPRRRRGRNFLEPLLVREYRTDRVFEAIDELLQHQQADDLRRDALLFAYRQFPALNPAQRMQLRHYNFYVPVEDGSWRRATGALFHPGWGTEGARRMDRFLTSGGDSIADFAQQRERWIRPPTDWPEQVDDPERWEAFLSDLGVRDGLLLFQLGARLSERDGNALQPESLARQFNLDHAIAREWPALVRRNWSEFRHPFTKYAFDRPLSHLPGTAAVQDLGAKCRQEFAGLVLFGLRTWDDHCFSVRIRRPTRPTAQQDPHQWPTPFSAQLSSLPWLPILDESAPDGVRFVPPRRAWHSVDGDMPAFVPPMPLSTRRMLADDTTLRRLKDAGLRRWEDGRHGPDLVRDLGELLDAGAVLPHLAAQFKKHYQRGWSAALFQDEWPWKDGEPPRLAVTESSSLTVIEPDGDTLVFVADEDNHFKESLLDLAGHPVLVADTKDGQALSRFLRANGTRTKGFTDTEVLVEGDGQPIGPVADVPRVAEQAPWLPIVFGLLLELRSGDFRRRSERAVRELMERVRSLRMVYASSVKVVIEGAVADSPPSTRSLPVNDDRHPTVIVWDVDEGGWEAWRAASPAICQVLRQPGLQAHLELAIVKLEKRFGDDVPNELLAEDLAAAIDAPTHRVAELLRSLTGELAELVHRLRPALICLLGTDRCDEVNGRLRRVSDGNALHHALATWADELPIDIDHLLADARLATTVDELRKMLHLDLGNFNDVLIALGAPYRQITHPDLHEHAFSEFVAQHEARIIERLRERYAELASQGDDTTRYVEARQLDGLAPLEEWLLRYEVPPESELMRVVSLWLQGHGAETDLGAAPRLPDPVSLRQANFAKVDDVVERMTQLVAAWCRRDDRAIPPTWSSVPLITVRSRIEADGIADLIDLSEDVAFQRAVDALGWPDEMPRTLSLSELHLTEANLIASSGPDASASAQRRPRPTIDLAGRHIEVGTEHLAEIARAAHESVDERFLAQKGTARLGEAPAPRARQSQGGGGSIVVASNPRMSEDQRTAVGLVGEVAARAWLERRYASVLWRSGYASIVTGEPEASDTWGFDFEVPRGNTSLYFEVKAFTDAPREQMELEMGESEVRVAQECAGGDRYRILVITSVLEPDARQVIALPSPFSKKGAGRFRVVGRGLRYRCQLGGT